MSELWDAYVTYWKKYVDVHSLSTRMEYWTPTIANTILIGVLSYCGKVGNYLSWILVLATIVPDICVFIRRMHDAGASAKLFWMGLIPFAGIFFQWMYTLIMFMPHNYYNTNFFAWNDRDEVQTDHGLGWMWIVSSIMTAVSILLWIVFFSAILALISALYAI